jgi:hypothetical protein
MRPGLHARGRQRGLGKADNGGVVVVVTVDSAAPAQTSSTLAWHAASFVSGR